ncbi:hypothetical protein AAY473_009288 [Plecturocebus cupreus]
MASGERRVVGALCPELEFSSMISSHRSLQVQVILPPQPPEGLGLQRWGFIMLARLVLNSSDLPALASQSAGITVMSHCTLPDLHFLNKKMDRILLCHAGWSAVGNCLPVLPRMVLNFWPQAILPSQPPKAPG